MIKLILTLSEVKGFLRIEQDYTLEDTFLESLIESAEMYILNATDKTFDSTNELAKLAVKMLITHWYENRQVESYSNSNSKKISFSLDCILTQLRFCEGGVSV